LVPSIKWPNDVLVRGHKVAGVLVESMWSGNHLEASVLGIGVNVLQGSYPSRAGLSYPATTLEAELRRRPDRADFLRAVIASIMRWRPSMASDEFLRTWESNLAFRGQQVVLTRDEEAPLIGILLGLEPDGSLRLEANQRTIRVQMGEIHLSAANDRIA
jgi:BirA family biotin operon repressor/biotin-[acetyl-CoA-carboxylase] ligase